MRNLRRPGKSGATHGQAECNLEFELPVVSQFVFLSTKNTKDTKEESHENDSCIWFFVSFVHLVEKRKYSKLRHYRIACAKAIGASKWRLSKNISTCSPVHNDDTIINDLGDTSLKIGAGKMADEIS